MMKTFLATSLTVGLVWFWMAGCTEDGKKTGQPQAVQKVRGVEVIRVIPEEVAVTFATAGALRAVTASVVTSRIVGNVAALLVREGDRDEKGQTLLQIESPDIAAKVAQARGGLQAARAALANARATFDRISALHGRGSATPHELDGARMQLDAARGAVQQAEGAVREARSFEAYRFVQAPFAGTITRKMIDVGEQAAPGRPLLQVEGNGGLQFETEVPASLLASIRMGQSASVTIEALKGERLDGRVAEMEAAADPVSHSAKVKIDLEDTGGALSGLYGKAEFVIGKRAVILVPAQAVVTRGQLTAVYVIGQERQAHFRLVRTGKRFDDRLEILSGLQGGEQVAVSRLDLLVEGAEIVE